MSDKGLSIVGGQMAERASLDGVERQSEMVSAEGAFPEGELWHLDGEGGEDQRLDVLSLDPIALCDLVEELAEKPYRARQIFRWLHEKQVTSFDEMSDLPTHFRDQLKERARVVRPSIKKIQVSKDGTRKYQLETWDGHLIESVFIPEASGPEKNALCISSQVGCAMGCTFCATAAIKLKRHLSPGEIAGQYHAVTQDLVEAGLDKTPEGRTPRPITNVVYMGMGEPLHNYRGVVGSIRILTHVDGPNLAPRRITVSTSGIVPAIDRLGQDTDVHLAVSLNGSHDAGRVRVMPVNRKWPLSAVLDACRRFPLKRNRRITFEYVLLGGENDSDADAERVAGLLEGIPTKVNLIPFNAHPLSPYRRPSDDRVRAFQDILNQRGFAAYIRSTRGDDIDAACGMLGAEKLEEARAGGSTGDTDGE